MSERFIRTEMLLGKEAMDRLAKAKVLVFGIGGVGGHTVDGLARSGVGEIHLVDSDIISESNINRQLIATTSTVGKLKVEAMKDRILDINPECIVKTYNCFYLPENKEEFDFSIYDYIVDAVDTITAKLTIIEEATRLNVPVISSMGAGNKLKPELFEVADIYETSVCPIAKVMRKELKKRGIMKLKCVYSKEESIKPLVSTEQDNSARRRAIPASVAFTPSVAGLIIAGEVIKDISYGR